MSGPSAAFGSVAGCPPLLAFAAGLPPGLAAALGAGSYFQEDHIKKTKRK